MSEPFFFAMAAAYRDVPVLTGAGRLRGDACGGPSSLRRRPGHRGGRARPADAGRGSPPDGGLRGLPVRLARDPRRPPASAPGDPRPRGLRASSRRSATASRASHPATTSCARGSRSAARAAGARRDGRPCASGWRPSTTASSPTGRPGSTSGTSGSITTCPRRSRSGSVVPANTAIKVDPALPLDQVALLGCAVMTGVDAVLNTAGCARATRAS